MTTILLFLEKQKNPICHRSTVYQADWGWKFSSVSWTIYKHSVLIKKSFHGLVLQMLLWSKSLWQQLHHVKKCRNNSGLIVSFEVEFIIRPNETKWQYLNCTFMPVLRYLKGSDFIYSFISLSLLEWPNLLCLATPDSPVQGNTV